MFLHLVTAWIHSYTKITCSIVFFFFWKVLKQVKMGYVLDTFIAMVFAALVLPRCCSGSGQFSLELLTYRNIRGEVYSGACCQGTARNRSVCLARCNTFFKFCLREYQTRIAFDGSCTFGNVTSEFVADKTLDGDNRTALVLPFDFAWTVSFV